MDITAAERILFLLLSAGGLVITPLVVGHWRGSSRRIEDGTEHLPFSARTKRRWNSTVHTSVGTVVSISICVLAITADPPVPVVGELAGALFVASTLLELAVWFFGRPRVVVPPRFRVEDWSSPE